MISRGRSTEALNIAADRAMALSSALWGVVVLRAVGTLSPSGMEEAAGGHVVDGQVSARSVRSVLGRAPTGWCIPLRLSPSPSLHFPQTRS